MISVVVPVYNRELTIRRCLDSVLTQTFSDIELIVVDDCSTDKTASIVQSYSDERIIYSKLNSNSGAAAARNHGVALSRGDYVAFQDSDDLWYPTKLERQIEYINRYSADICVCRLKRFGYGEHDDPIVPSMQLKGGIQSYETVLRGSLFAMPAVFIDGDLARKVQFDTRLKWHEDYEWSIRVSEGNKVILLDEILGEVYLQPNSVSLRNVVYELDFYNRVIPKLSSLYGSYPWFKALLYTARGNCRTMNGEQGISDYQEAFRSNPTPKGFVRCLLSHTSLLKSMLMKMNEDGTVQ